MLIFSYAKSIFIRLICVWMKIDLHMKGWAPTLVSKKRPEVIRKWPITRSRERLSRWKGRKNVSNDNDYCWFCFCYLKLTNELQCKTLILTGYRSEGIPSEEALLSLYCELTGDSLPLLNWSYFLALVLFRLIVNIQVGWLWTPLANIVSRFAMGQLNKPIAFKVVV